MKISVLIIAGGKGERFWPKSRRNLPKQFISITGGNGTMIQRTVRRVLKLVPYDDIYISTNTQYLPLVKDQLPEIPSENILVEPVAKNTAPCIGLAAEIMQAKYGDAIMVVLPADHLIKNNDEFISQLKQAAEVAKSGENLVTLGIAPSYPETGYGYINFNQADKAGEAYSVVKFVEKPSIEKAKAYIDSGAYLWNSGMFIWKVSSILANFKKYLPEMHEGIAKIATTCNKDNFTAVLNEEFNKFQAESIDYGIMEKAENIYTIKGVFGWDDVGSWSAVERLTPTEANNNSLETGTVSVNSANNIVVANKLVALVGVKDIIVVDTEDALLVCAKDSAQDVKKVTEVLKSTGNTELL